jgi:hypothetical protein
MGRPRKIADDGETAMVSVRVPADMLPRLEKCAKLMQADLLGVTVTRGDCLRRLIWEGLQSRGLMTD